MINKFFNIFIHHLIRLAKSEELQPNDQNEDEIHRTEELCEKIKTELTQSKHEESKENLNKKEILLEIEEFMTQHNFNLEQLSNLIIDYF